MILGTDNYDFDEIQQIWYSKSLNSPTLLIFIVTKTHVYFINIFSPSVTSKSLNMKKGYEHKF